MATPWGPIIQGVTGLAGSLFGGSGSNRMAHTQADIALQQAGIAQSGNSLANQIVQQMLKNAGYNLSFQNPTGQASGAIPGKFVQPTPTLTRDAGYNPFNEPGWKNTNAQVQANNQALKRKLMPRIAGNNLSGLSQKGASAYNLNQSLAENTNTAARQYGQTAEERAQQAVMTALNLAQSQAGQALPAAQQVGQAGQQIYAQDQAALAQQQAAFANIGELIAEALDKQNQRKGGSDPTNVEYLPYGVGGNVGTQAAFNYYTGGALNGRGTGRFGG